MGRATEVALKDQAHRFAESTLANTPSGAADVWTSNDEVWSIHRVPPQHDFYAPSGEEGAHRVQKLLSCRMAHVDPSPDATDDEPFGIWTEDLDFQQSNDRIQSCVDRQSTGFAVFFETPD